MSFLWRVFLFFGLYIMYMFLIIRLNPLVKQFVKDLNLTTILKTICINRSTYYYWLKIEKKLKLKEEKQLLQQKRLQNLCLHHQYFYGHRKITDLYQKTFNEPITKKKVYLIMKENNICCKLRSKKINIIIIKI
ncbi:Transposase, fragment [Candidatus Phytoplasma australiense]|uniref:Transposase n=1 Tax=Phytoplasma australiense TaxID=59748 RepID=B1VA02_PHYAS|nr:Transposase, fragment [Candidatus Phytoplasma australiense]